MSCSGQTPLDPKTGKVVERGLAAQTIQCFANLFHILDAAGLASEDVVAVQVYLVDMNDSSEKNEVYARHFAPPYPARTTIGCASLPLRARIEVGLTAKDRS